MQFTSKFIPPATKRPFDQVYATGPSSLMPLMRIKSGPDGQSSENPGQEKRKRQRLQADPDLSVGQAGDLASTLALSEALKQFIVEYAYIEQVLSSGPSSVAELLQQPWHNVEGKANKANRSLFPVRIVTQVDGRIINGFACTSLFGTMKKPDRAKAIAMLDSCLDSLANHDDHSFGGDQRVERSTSNPDLLHVSASISFSSSRIDAVKSFQALANWAQELVSKDKSRRLDKLIRTAVLSPALMSTNLGADADFCPWSPLDRVFAVKLVLESTTAVSQFTIGPDSSKYSFIPMPATTDGTSDPMAVPDSKAIPWVPAALQPLPIDLLTNNHLADFILFKIMAHFSSTPRGKLNATNPTLSIHETLRVLDKILARLFPYVPTRCIAARAILQHLASQRRIHLATCPPRVILHPPPPGADFHVPPGLSPKSTIASLCPEMLAIPSSTDTGNPLMQSFTRAVWQTLEARHARTVPAMMHQLVYFHSDVSAAADSLSESERWVMAEYAVWRAWSELKVVGIKVMGDKAVSDGVEVGLEEVQALIANSAFGVGQVDPRALMLVELVNGAAPVKGPARRKGKEGA